MEREQLSLWWLALPEFWEIFMSKPNGRGATESPLEFAQRLSLPFLENPRLLTRALTHTSYINEHTDAPDDNERLEFLGDAVLEVIVSAWLYTRFPEMREGEMTRMRSSLVRTEQLAAFSRQIGVGDALRLGKGEQSTGGSNRDALLCNAFEAITGALYLQSDLPTVEKFIFPFLESAEEKIVSDVDDNYDAKSRLQEWTQANKMGTPSYIVLNEKGPDHSKIFEMEVLIGEKSYGKGSGQSKSVAAQSAAKETLKMLGLG